MTPEKAKRIVQKLFGDYKIEYCVPYKNQYIVMAHPDEGPEDQEHGYYSDPFYAVNKITGRVTRFIPAGEKDHGTAFFNAVRQELLNE